MSGKRQMGSSRKGSTKPQIEKTYESLFVIPNGAKRDDDNSSLEQPTIYEAVETVTTYGAYEDPL